MARIDFWELYFFLNALLKCQCHLKRYFQWFMQCERFKKICRKVLLLLPFRCIEIVNIIILFSMIKWGLLNYFKWRLKQIERLSPQQPNSEVVQEVKKNIWFFLFYINNSHFLANIDNENSKRILKYLGILSQLIFHPCMSVYSGAKRTNSTQNSFSFARSL